MELKIDKERVQKAAESCPDAKRVLKILFPEAFEGSIWDKMKVGTKWTRRRYPGTVNVYIGKGRHAHALSGIEADYIEGRIYSRQNGQGVWTAQDDTDGIEIIED